MTTLKDVAGLAGVSTATASLALNGGKVNAETRQRVLSVARRLNYIPNRVGRMLNTGRSGTICLLFMTSIRHADIVHHTSLFYYLLEGIMDVTRKAKYSLRLEIRSHEDPDLLLFFEQMIGDRSQDGLIIIPEFLTDYPFLGLLQARKFPYIMFRPARFGSDVNFVDIENASGGRMVADLLVSLGHRRVALINGPQTHVDAIERERGFLEALAGAGIHDVAKRYGDFLIQSGFNAMKEILKEERPEAVFCANDYMAAGAIKHLSESGLRVPDDLTVIGYDNNDICQGIVPSLTTVDHRLEELGRRLGQGLLSLIEGTETEVRKSIMPTLVERQSHARSTVTRKG